MQLVLVLVDPSARQVEGLEAGLRLRGVPVRATALEPLPGVPGASRPGVQLLRLRQPEALAELCAQLRAVHPADSLSLVVVGEGIALAEAALRAGADDFWPAATTSGEQVALALDELVRQRAAPQQARRSTVLVADDDALLRRIVCDGLEREGHTTLPCADGREVLEVLEEGRPEVGLLLLDLFMPGLGGLELVRQMREMPRWRQTPVLAISGMRQAESTASDLARLGVAALLTKDPATLEKLPSRVGEALGTRPQRMAPRVASRILAEFRRAPHEPWLPCIIRDLGPGGAYARTLLPPRPESTVHLRLELGPGRAPLVAIGRVAWARGPQDGLERPGMGVEFLGLAPEQARALEAMVA